LSVTHRDELIKYTKKLGGALGEKKEKRQMWSADRTLGVKKKKRCARESRTKRRDVKNEADSKKEKFRIWGRGKSELEKGN